MCLFRGCCVESGSGLCRGEQRGGKRALRFCREPGSQLGRWLNHLPSAIQPTPQTHVRVSAFHRKAHEYTHTCTNSPTSSPSLFLQVPQHSGCRKMACQPGSSKYKPALFTRIARDGSSYTHQRGRCHKRVNLIKHFTFKEE